MITGKPNPFVQIRYDDPRFMLTDGIFQTTIGGMEITADCPAEYREMLLKAWSKGWIVPYVMMKQELDYCI